MTHTPETVQPHIQWCAHLFWWPRKVHRADDPGNHDECFPVTVERVFPPGEVQDQ